MRLDIEQINRLGFDAWADNVIINILEDMKGNDFERMAIEAQDYEALIAKDAYHCTYIVRAYVEGEGWKAREHSIKIGGQP